jgi:hypothetical protein
MDAQLLELVPPGGGVDAGAADDDDFTIANTGASAEEDKFDAIIGMLEDTIMGAQGGKSVGWLLVTELSVLAVGRCRWRLSAVAGQLLWAALCHVR